MQSIFYYAVFYPAIELISAVAAALIIWFGGGWVMTSALTLGSLVASLQYASRFFRPISDMSEKFNVLQGAMASSERIFQLLDTPVEIISGSRIADPQSRLGRIAFENVTFAYVAGEPVLRNVSFEVEPGRRVALVGIMVMMIWIDWRVAIVAFSVLPLIWVVTQWFRRNVRESYRTVRIVRWSEAASLVRARAGVRSAGPRAG